ncbi:MAG: hypothetical protein LBF24_00255 [Puniceicoccales bacterium]|nr:hypothetical protein [Puniceicoccales bacterium]
MARLLKCDCCGAPATVHLVRVCDGATSRINFCAVCAKAKGVVDEAGSPTEMLLGSELFQSQRDPDAVVQSTCAGCGLNGAELLKRKTFGCERCYETFSSLLNSLLRRIQRGKEHCGKRPQSRTIFLRTAAVEWDRSSTRAGENLPERLSRDPRELELLLSLAVTEERYEEAALIRQHIDTLRAAKVKNRKKSMVKAKR